MLRKGFSPLLLVATVGFVWLFGCNRSPEQTPREAPPNQVAPARFQVAYAGEDEPWVVRVGGRSVSEATFRRWLATAAGGGPHGGDDTAAVARQLVNRELVVRDVLDRRLWDMLLYRSQVDLAYLSNLGVEYVQKVLPARITFPARDLAEAVPDPPMVGEFELLLFDGMDSARNAGIASPEAFERYADEHPDRLKSTGEITTGSGFFHPYDDIDLFNRAPGEVVGPVETGVGAAVVRVRSIRRLTAEEIGEMVAKIREALVARRVPGKVDEILRHHRIALDRAAVRRLAAVDLARGVGVVDDGVVARVDGREISYLNLKWWLPRDYRDYLKDLTPERYAELLNGALENLAQQIALGSEAEGEGRKLTGADARLAFDEMKRRLYFSAGMLDAMGGDRVAEEDVRRYYEERAAGEFGEPARVLVRQVFTATEVKAREAREAILKGAEFRDVVTRFSEDETSREKGGLVGWLTETMNLYPGVREALFGESAPGPGETTDVVTTPKGFHVFQVVERRKARQVPLDEVRDRIIRTLRAQRYQQAKARYLDELRRKYRVEVDEQRLAAVVRTIEAAAQRPAVPAGHP